MTWREAHRRRVLEAEAQAVKVMHSALASILEQIAARFGAITADAQPGEARANLDDLSAIAPEWRAAVDAELLPLFAEHYTDGAYQAAAQVAATTGRAVPIVPVELVDQGALNYLADAKNRFWALGDEAWGHARDELVAGFDAGEGINQLRNRLRASVDMSTSHAEALARTEVIAASNLGSLATVAAMGNDMPPFKQWLATNDARTRPTHRHADGNVVRIDQPFEVGGSFLKVPGDPAGPAAEVVNCRCTVLYLDSPEPIDPDLPGRGSGGVPDVVTAAASGPAQVDSTTGEPHTGAMIALVPADPDAYTVEGGEPADALHLTLGYLGEAADIPPEVLQALLDMAEGAASEMVPLTSANVFGAATWNTTGDSPSMVLNIGGPGLGEAHDVAWTLVELAAEGSDWAPPEQHAPWVAHMCLAYGDPTLMNPVLAATAFEGPIVFDRLRVMSGSDAYDFPLTGQPEQEDLPMDRAELATTVTEAVRAAIAGADVSGPITINLAAGPPASGTPSGVGGPEPQPGEHLHAVMHVLGASTGDNDTGRVFLNTDYRQPPFSYNWQVRSSAHGGLPEVVHVGNVVRVVEEGAALHAFITLDLGGADGAEYARRSVDGIERWVSMGLDETVPASITVTWPPMPDEPEAAEGDDEVILQPLRTTFDGGRIGELTGTSVPAQADATVEPTDELRMLMGVPAPDEQPEPVDPEDDAERAALAASAAGGTVSPLVIRASAALLDRVDSVHTGHAGSDCSCGGSCGECRHDVTPEPTPADVVQAITAAAATIVIPDLPPAAWFHEPTDVPMDGALNINADGRVWGLLAPKGTGHRAYAAAGRRLDVPWGNVDYARFMGAWALTADSGQVHAGPLTMDCGHAPNWRPNPEAGRQHYDNTCSVIGAVAVGESASLGGVWMAGALLPGVTADQVARALACRCSGDWQPHPDEPGRTELIACLLVPSPGFARAHQGATTEHRDGVLVASSVPVHWAEAAPARPSGAQRYASVVLALSDAVVGSPAQRVLDLTN